MARFLAHHARLLGTASFQGRLYRVAHYPAVVPSSDPGDIVRGEIHELERLRWLLGILDEYEGYDPQAHSGEYLRSELLAQLDTGAKLSAWVYVYNRPVGQLARIVSGVFED